jgi:hypothetical protein
MNPTDVMKYGQRTVLQTLEAFPKSAADIPGACGFWSVKDIIAHLASFEHLLVDVLSTFIGSASTAYMKEMLAEGGQAFNDAEVSRRKVNSLSEVLKEFEDAHRQALSLVALISPELFSKVGTLPWYGAEYALDDYIVYTFYGHKREHSAQIAAFRDVIQQK